MKIKPSILQLLLITGMLILTISTAHANGFSRQISILNQPLISDTGGRAVNLDSAQACIDRFAALMTAHGFADQAGLPINIRLRKTSQITTGESFNGKDFLDWLNATAAQYAAAGKTMMIRIQMGVYDMNYLNTYQPSAALRAASNNRIALFVIPYDASTGQAVKALAQPSGGTGNGGTGYDLGGIQP
jgi:hypothetical protein